MSSTILTIPNDWRPRAHQQQLFRQSGSPAVRQSGYGRPFQRGCAVWHRRAGKDSVALNLTARDMFRRVGTYWHLFPEQTQARRAIWNGIDGRGRRIIDQVFPAPVRKRISGQEMLVETVNESNRQMVGSDNFDSPRTGEKAGNKRSEMGQTARAWLEAGSLPQDPLLAAEHRRRCSDTTPIMRSPSRKRRT